MAGSITLCLHRLRAAGPGEERERARRDLWRRSYDVLVRLAEQLVAREDAEDVTSKALATFFKKADGWSFRAMDSSAHFWALLKACVRNEALHLLEAAQAQKRGGGRARAGDGALAGVAASTLPPGEEPDAEDPQAVWAFLSFLDRLGDEPHLREIAFQEYYLGRAPAEVSQGLGVSQATFYRKRQRLLATVELFEEQLRHPEPSGARRGG
jgi:RNA polymerase sigma factor (sigma-70 family)